jgi:hypothetical protein
MRQGILIRRDQGSATGTILDENSEEIGCCIVDLPASIEVRDDLFFDILLTEYGLTAVNVIKKL